MSVFKKIVLETYYLYFLVMYFRFIMIITCECDSSNGISTLYSYILVSACSLLLFKALSLNYEMSLGSSSLSFGWVVP